MGGFKLKKRNRKSKSKTTAGQKALKMVKQIKSNFEKKYFNLTGNQALANTWAVYSFTTTPHLTYIAQGDTASSRDGNVISIRSIHLRGLVYFTNDVNEAVSCRILIVKDKQQVSDTAPAITDILDTTVVSNDITQMYNYPAQEKRFKILYDKSFGMNINTLTYNGSGINTGDRNIPFEKWLFPKCKVYYNGTAGSDIQKNGIYVYVFQTGSSINTTLRLTGQVCYTDN